MESLMDLQTACPRVAFGATMVRTNKWFFSCVSQLMSLKMALGDELLVALRAHKWSFARVGSHMGLEISGFRELFQALLKGAY